jgi:hypothetical protein
MFSSFFLSVHCLGLKAEQEEAEDQQMSRRCGAGEWTKFFSNV